MNVQVVSTLLSVGDDFKNIHTLQSILILSGRTALVNSGTIIYCSSSTNSSYAVVHDRSSPNNDVVKNYSDIIFYQYLFSTRLDVNLTTYFYICGVNDDLQTWSFGDGNPYGYEVTDSIGEYRTTYSNYFAYSVLIAREPYPLTSVLFLTLSDNIEVNVACSSVTQMVTIAFTEVLPPPTATTETTKATASSSSSPTTTESTEQGMLIFIYNIIIMKCRDNDLTAVYKLHSVPISVSGISNEISRSKIKIKVVITICLSSTSIVITCTFIMIYRYNISNN